MKTFYKLARLTEFNRRVLSATVGSFPILHIVEYHLNEEAVSPTKLGLFVFSTKEDLINFADCMRDRYPYKFVVIECESDTVLQVEKNGMVNNRVYRSGKMYVPKGTVLVERLKVTRITVLTEFKKCSEK